MVVLSDSNKNSSPYTSTPSSAAVLIYRNIIFDKCFRCFYQLPRPVWPLVVRACLARHIFVAARCAPAIYHRLLRAHLFHSKFLLVDRPPFTFRSACDPRTARRLPSLNFALLAGKKTDNHAHTCPAPTPSAAGCLRDLIPLYQGPF